MFKTATTVCALILSFVVGATLRTGLDYSRVYRTAYQKGRAEATTELNREAIRNGHGHWEWVGTDQPNRFAWNPVLHQYDGDRARKPLDDAIERPDMADSSPVMQLLQ